MVWDGTGWNSAEGTQGTYTFLAPILHVSAQRIKPLWIDFDLGFKQIWKFKTTLREAC